MNAPLGRVLPAAAAFAIAIVALAWKGVEALPQEVEREAQQYCMPLEPHPTFTPRQAQDFSLKDYQGRTVSLSAYRGRVVFLNFWATWCPPCRDEMDSMDRLARALEGRLDFAMLAVSEDKGWDAVRSFFPNGTKMTVVLDDNWATAHAWGTEKLPETYLIDKHGMVQRYVINKRDWSSPQAMACIKSLLD
jgi:thiol-disulfide isomerase/thioredoxin